MFASQRGPLLILLGGLLLLTAFAPVGSPPTGIWAHGALPDSDEAVLAPTSLAAELKDAGDQVVEPVPLAHGVAPPAGPTGSAEARPIEAPSAASTPALSSPLTRAPPAA